MILIGIDIGTGSTKAVAIDSTGTVLDSSQAHYSTLSGEGGISEQDPEEVWSAFILSVSTLVRRLNAPPAAISLSSAMHSLIPVSADGVPLGNMMTWADGRSAGVASRLRSIPIGRTLYEETGTPLHAMSPLCKIIWLRENRQPVFEDAAKFISIKEFIWYKLFGIWEIDYSIASATGLFNIHDLTWHATALAEAGISESRLSHPVNTTTFRKGINKAIAERMGIPETMLIMIGASDGCHANIGSLATEPGIAALTIGTSGAIRVTRETPAVNWEHMTFNYRLTNKYFVSGGPINNGGVALKWYAQSLLKRPLDSMTAYAELLGALTKVPAGSEGLFFLPYILGERAPIWNSNACGVFFGITAQHQQEHFTKAVIEGILFSLYQIMKAIESDGVRIKQIHVSGGFVNSPEWVQLLATIFGKKVVLVNRDDASAIGAAFLAFDAMEIKGGYNKFNEQETISFEPDPDVHHLYDTKYFPVYERLYRSLSQEMQTLYDMKTDKQSSGISNILN